MPEYRGEVSRVEEDFFEIEAESMLEAEALAKDVCPVDWEVTLVTED